MPKHHNRTKADTARRNKLADFHKTRRAANRVTGGIKTLGKTISVFADELTGGKSTELGNKINKGIRTGVSKGNTIAADLINKGKAKYTEKVRGRLPGAIDTTKAGLKTGLEAGKAGLDKSISSIKQNIPGEPALRANERLKTGNTRNFYDRFSNRGSTPEPIGKNARVQGSRFKSALRTGSRFASRAFAPIAVGATALETGINLGGAAMDTDAGRDTLRLLDKGESAGARSAKYFGLSGGGETSGIVKGQDTLGTLNDPGMTRPPTDSGGFFSTDARSLNPNRFVEEMDQGPNGSGSLSRDQLLRGEQFNPDEPNVPLGGPETSNKEVSPSLNKPAQDTAQDPNNKRISLREAMTGYESTGEPLGDAMALRFRLGLAGSFNEGLGKRNKFGLDQQKFGLEQDKFGETKRQNAFTNAIDLNTAHLDNLAAQGNITEAEANTRKDENKVFMDMLGNATTDEQKRDIAFTQARNDNFDPTSVAVQTMFSQIMREIPDEEGGRISKILGGMIPNFFGGAEGTSSFTDSFDGRAPLLGADSIHLFSIDGNNNLTAQKETNGPQSFVLSLEDLPDTSEQFLRAVLKKQEQRRSLRN